MTDIRFYHLQTKTLTQALPEILGKALSKPSRILIKMRDMDKIKSLDKSLWTDQPASFLPHGIKGDGQESHQPILLTDGDENLNKADTLFITNGVEPANIDTYALCCEFLENGDDEAIAQARTRWKSYKEQGHDVTYWKQNERGGWDKKS